MNATKRWSDLGESTFVLGVWFLYGVHRWLGRLPFRVCLYPVVFYYWLFRPTARQASQQYLARLQASHRVFAVEPGLRQSFGHFLCFAETLLDKLLAMSGRYQPERFRFESHDVLKSSMQTGTGGIIVTAHMGCLELMQAAAGRRDDFKITILVHTAHAVRFNRILQRINPATRVELMQVTDFSPVTVMMLADRVAAGEFVAIAGDRVPVQGDRVVRVPFLGEPAPLPIGPYLLASLLGCPVYLLSCLHRGDGYVAQMHRLTERVVLPRATREQALSGYAREFAAWLEDRLRSSPYDWFNFFPFWDQIPHVRTAN